MGIFLLLMGIGGYILYRIAKLDDSHEINIHTGSAWAHLPDDDSTTEWNLFDDIPHHPNNWLSFSDDLMPSGNMGMRMFEDLFSSSGMGSYDGFYSLPSINPASGLPMMGCVDVAGNPYGTDLSHNYSLDSWDSYSSSHDSFSSSFDSWSSSSGSGFSDW